MPRVFDPYETRRHVVSDFARTHDFDEKKAHGVLHSFAASLLSSAYYGCMVGVEEQALVAASQARTWLEAAIENKEDEIDYWMSIGIYENLGMAIWLTENRNDEAVFSRAVDRMERHVQVLADKGEPLKETELDGCMQNYVQSGRYKDGIALYEQYGRKFTGSVTGVKTVRRLGYAICKSYVDGSYDLSKALEAGRNVLAKEMSDWLARGHASNAATWLKIFHWHAPSNQSTAVETLKQAYDYLPGIKRPKSPKEIEESKARGKHDGVRN